MKIPLINKYTVITLAAAVAAICADAINPVLTRPRTGDTLPVLNLKHEPVFTDSMLSCPAILNNEIHKQYEMKVWAPSASDSVSEYVITMGRDITALALKGDSLLQLSKTSPGYIRRYEQLPFWGYPTGAEGVQTINSSGRLSGIDPFRTTGTYHIALQKGLSMVTFDGDTLYNVECCVTEIDETVIYNEADTSLYKSTVRQWYAPGYRYPLLTHEDGVLFSTDTGTPGRVSRWYATECRSQEELIENDPVNKDIRARQKEMKNIPPSQKQGKNPARNNSSDNQGFISFNPGNGSLTVAPSPFEFTYNSYILCDVSGIVYQSGDMPQEGLTLNTYGMHSGEYILYIATSDTPLIYKFKNITR